MNSFVIFNSWIYLSPLSETKIFSRPVSLPLLSAHYAKRCTRHSCTVTKWACEDWSRNCRSCSYKFPNHMGAILQTEKKQWQCRCTAVTVLAEEKHHLKLWVKFFAWLVLTLEQGTLLFLWLFSIATHSKQSNIFITSRFNYVTLLLCDRWQLWSKIKDNLSSKTNEQSFMSRYTSVFVGQKEQRFGTNQVKLKRKRKIQLKSWKNPKICHGHHQTNFNTTN